MESEAYNLISKAESKLNAGFLKSIFSSKESRLEEALELYEKAGNIFKLNKKWSEAGECFEKCGNIEEKLKSDPASHYQDASHCYSFIDKKKSYDALQKCLTIYKNQGRFQMAGKLEKQIAEDFESELKYDEAINSYRKASEYFSMESLNSKSYEQACSLKVADLMCENNHPEAYKEGKMIYEKIAMQYLAVPLLKSSAKDLFFKSIVVHLTFDDYLTADAYLNKYLNEDPTMDDTREINFLKEAITAVKEKNVYNLKVAITKLKQYVDINKWKINMFNKIVTKLEQESQTVIEEDDISKFT